MDERTYTEFTPEKASTYLDWLSKGHTVTASAKKAGVSRGTVYLRRDTDGDFAKAWDQAVEAGTECLEEEARRRAHDGVLEPVYQRGAKVGTVRKYSDTLLIFLLKGRKPHVYRDNSLVEHTGKVNLQHGVDLASLSDDELALLERIAARAADPAGDPGGAGEA